MYGVLVLVQGETLDREPVAPPVQHLLGNGRDEAIWTHRSRTVANPRGALNINATLCIGSALRQEVVYPKPPKRRVMHLSKEATSNVG